LLWSRRDEQKPSDDLPNQEKNQHRTIYIDARAELYIQNEQPKLSDQFEEGK